MIHYLKTWPEPFQDVFDLQKLFEVRKLDRPYKKADILYLQEWDPITQEYSGREIRALIRYILEGGKFGIEEGYGVIGIEIQERWKCQ